MTELDPRTPSKFANAIIPDYALGNHNAALGLAFSSGTLLPEQYRNGAFIGQHGSWNRIPESGYKMVFVAFADGRPNGKPVDILIGFLSQDDEALGRPVGVIIDRSGACRRRCRKYDLACNISETATLELNLQVELVGEIRGSVARSEQNATRGLPFGPSIGMRELMIGDGAKRMLLC